MEEITVSRSGIWFVRLEASVTMPPVAGLLASDDAAASLDLTKLSDLELALLKTRLDYARDEVASVMYKRDTSKPL